MGIELSIILVNWNGADCIGRCLASLPQAAGRLRYETMVVDNASEDGSVTLLRHDFPHVTVIENSENIGFGRAAQQALARTLAISGRSQPRPHTGAAFTGSTGDLSRSRPRPPGQAQGAWGPFGKPERPKPLVGMRSLRWSR